MYSYLIILLLVGVGFVAPHGYLRNPLARTSIHLDPSFGAQQPFYWNNHGVWCGNVPQNLQYSTCGRCGEPPGGRDFSQGGNMDKGIIVRSYTAGSIIDVEVEFSAGHLGFYEIELCAQQTETDTCFQRLEMVGGTHQIRDGTRICVPYDNGGTRFVTARVQLPSGVRCARCTLRWTYRTSYPVWWDPEGRWDPCFDPDPAQTFRNCADISIV